MKTTFKQLSLAAIFGMALWTLAGQAARAADEAGADNIDLPKDQIEKIMGIKGDVTNGVLDLGVGRDDMGKVKGPRGVEFDSSFELNGDIFFQPLGGGRAFLNGDVPLKEDEVNDFVSELLKEGLVFQAVHQHLPMSPQLWFVHFRGTGDPITLAHGLRAALNRTHIKFPQKPPTNPTTPLDSKRLASILHGVATVEDKGVVVVWVLRKDTINVGGTEANSQANVSTNIDFSPTGGGAHAAVVADMAMTAEEVNPVVKLMLNSLGWYQGCLYNQETGERPQLYFDHMLKTGDAYQLAAEIRSGLNLTKAK